MSVVIIGGHERMVRQYEEICEKHGCDAKVFVKERSGFKKNLGTPDLMILLTNTVSHRSEEHTSELQSRLRATLCS